MPQQQLYHSCQRPCRVIVSVMALHSDAARRGASGMSRDTAAHAA